MKKTVYIHIGEHKTGTTAIQNFLCANHKVLKRAGYDYLYPEGYGTASHHLGRYLGFGGDEKLAEFNNSKLLILLKKQLEKIKKIR